MEAVGQNATLFPKSQISANLFFAQPYYLRQLQKLVSKVAEVSIVTFREPRRPVYYYMVITPAVIIQKQQFVPLRGLKASSAVYGEMALGQFRQGFLPATSPGALPNCPDILQRGFDPQTARATPTNRADWTHAPPLFLLAPPSNAQAAPTHRRHSCWHWFQTLPSILALSFVTLQS